MDVMAESAFCETEVTTLAKDFTEDEPPAHVHLVCHLSVVPLRPSTPEH